MIDKKKISPGAMIVSSSVPSELLKNARDLRKRQTPSENILWQELRNRQLNNWKFRRQHPLTEGFILDFYCAETKVALEIDGSYHQEQQQYQDDKTRSEYLAEYDIRVMRIQNDEILHNVKHVLKAIVTFTDTPPLSTVERGRG
jgi:very-short-patch-repair endonuclease